MVWWFGSRSDDSTATQPGSTEQFTWTESSHSAYCFIPLKENYTPKKCKPVLRSTRLGMTSRLTERRRKWLSEEFYKKTNRRTNHTVNTSLLRKRLLRLSGTQYRNPTVRTGGDSWTIPGFSRSGRRPVLTKSRAPSRPWNFVMSTGYCWNSGKVELRRRRQLIKKTREALKTQYEELTNELVCLTKTQVRQKRPIRPPPSRTAPPHVWSTIRINDSLQAIVRFEHVPIFPKMNYTVKDLQQDYASLLSVCTERDYPHISIKRNTSELWSDTPLTGLAHTWKQGDAPLRVELRKYGSGGSMSTKT
jgi:hypothetical protein